MSIVCLSEITTQLTLIISHTNLQAQRLKHKQKVAVRRAYCFTIAVRHTHWQHCVDGVSSIVGS